MRTARLLRLLPALVVSVVLLEMLSFGAGTLLHGAGYFPRARQDRARIANDEPEPAGGVAQRSSLRSYVLHPYLGFIADDDATTGPTANTRGRLVRTELGFFRRTDALAPTTSDPIRIGIFGGSVAFMFGTKAEQALARAVAASPEAAGREVVVENFALPGHKQPQQLFTLLYLLLLGRRFDVVVNIDGFNELVLPVTENLAHGSAAIYPRSWSLMATGAAGTSLREAAVTRSDDAALRRLLARTFSVRLVRRSFAATLLWQALDDALDARVATLDARLAARLGAQVPDALRGPPTAGAAVGDPLPELVRLWRESSLLMHEVCAANGIAYVHALQPNQYVPGSKPLAPRERQVAYRPDHPYRALVESGYPLLVAQGREIRNAGVRFVDLTKVFANVRAPIYVDDCCHFGARGDLLVATPLATAIVAALSH